MTRIIETVNLSKTYSGGIEALKSLNILINQGESIGFLGPNGAGKTTTIQILLNLIKASAGEVYLFEQKMLGQERKLLQNVGALVEMPGFYEMLTAEDTLNYVCRTFRMDKRLTTIRIKQVLEDVNLSDFRFKKVGTFSTGMKRRLGIAQVLVHEPELMILDEPTNGMDPKGVREMRDLIRSLNKDGKTVFMSSHNLTEVSEISDRVIFLDKGVKVGDEQIHALRNKLGSKHIEVKFLHPLTSKERDRILSIKDVKSFYDSDQIHIEYDGDSETTHRILQNMINEDIPVYSFRPRTLTLEDIYLKLYRKEDFKEINK